VLEFICYIFMGGLCGVCIQLDVLKMACCRELDSTVAA